MIKSSVAGPRGYLDWCGLTYRHALFLALDHYGYMHSLARRYGDLVPFTIFNRKCFLINGPELIHQTLVRQAAHVEKQHRNKSLIESVLSRGMLTIEGHEWRRDRLAIQSLIRADGLYRFASLASQITQEEIASWSPGLTVSLQRTAGRILMRTLCKCFFGRDSGEKTLDWFDAAVALSDRQMREVLQIYSLPDWVPAPAQLRKRKAKRAMQEAAQFLIRRDRDGTPAPIYEVLQRALAQQPEMLEATVTGESMTFIIAGVHTTAAALEWTFLELMKHDEFQAAVAQEADSAPTDNRSATFEINQLTYTRQVMLESVRMHPPVWALIAREAIDDFYLNGTLIPQGSWLYVYPKIVHRDPRWFPQPLVFDPDRFAPDAIESIPPRAFFPFGVGGHRCIGAPLAETVIPIVLATILQQFRLEPVGDLGDVVPQHSTVSYPRGGLQARVVPRKHPAPSRRKLAVCRR